MTADFRVLPYVTVPGAAAHTRASFVIEDRQPGLHKTADTPTPAPAAQLRAAEAGADTVQEETARP